MRKTLLLISTMLLPVSALAQTSGETPAPPAYKIIPAPDQPVIIEHPQAAQAQPATPAKKPAHKGAHKTAHKKHAKKQASDSGQTKPNPDVALNLDALNKLHEQPVAVPTYLTHPLQSGAQTAPSVQPMIVPATATQPAYTIIPKPDAAPAPLAAKPAIATTPAQAEPAVAAQTEAAITAPAAQPIPAPAPGSVENGMTIDQAHSVFKPTGFVQAGGNYDNVSHGFGNWFGQYVKGEVQTDPDNRWNGQVLHQHEFKEDGEYFNAGNTHIFNPDWYSDVSLGLGAGGDFLPRYRFDGFLNRKWLDQRQLVTTFGVGADKSNDGVHKDESLFAGATYYFPSLWVVQGGVRYNDSHPGSVNTFSEFAAVTEGTDKEHLITLRYGFGEESYQVVGPNRVLSDFYSNDVSLEWRQWVSQGWGFDIRGEEYHNPNYNRVGVDAGVFKEF